MIKNEIGGPTNVADGTIWKLGQSMIGVSWFPVSETLFTFLELDASTYP